MSELVCGYCGIHLSDDDTAEARQTAWDAHVEDCLAAAEGGTVVATIDPPARLSVIDMGKDKPKKRPAPKAAQESNGGKSDLEQFRYDLAGDVSQAVGLSVKNALAEGMKDMIAQAIEAAGGQRATSPQETDDDEGTGSVVEVSEDDSEGEDTDSKASRYRAAVKAGHKAEKAASGKKEQKAAAGYGEMARLLLADEDFEAKNQASITMDDGSVWTDNLLHLTWRRQAAPEFGISTGEARRIEGGLVMNGQVEGREGA